MSNSRFSFAVVLFAAFGPVAHAQTVFVTTVADKVDFFAPQKIANLPGPDGVVSMREAAIAVNNTGGIQTIGFHVPAGSWGTGTVGPILINAGTSFPILNPDTTIDGTTQTAFTGDTNPNGHEVAFFSTTTDVNLIQTGIFAISGDRVHVTGLGNMLGRNYGLDFTPAAEDGFVTNCIIVARFAAVRLQGDRNTVGGASPGLGCNLKSLSDGLRIHGLGGNVAEDNVAIGNVLSGEFNGVQIVGDATGNVIGGFLPGEANLIANAGYEQEDLTPDGAMVRIESDGNFVLGNLIGTDATGTAAATNNIGDVGVEIYGDGNTIEGNVIGGITGIAGFLSVQAGISLREGAELNAIQGNWIGVDKTGTVAIPNHIGIQIAAFDSSLPMPGNNHIGGLGAGEANVIAFNEACGVRVLLDSTRNRISGNVLHDNHANGGIGIDLGDDGSTTNDVGDTDIGPNLLMNRPRILSAVTKSTPPQTVITGKIDTVNPPDTTLEFFSNPTPPPGETVEAGTLIGLGGPAPDGTFVVTLSQDVSGSSITATATDLFGNTSEISAPVAAAASPWADLGFGLGIPVGGTPLLSGGGTLLPNSVIALSASMPALPLAQTYWFLGTSTLSAPFFGGTLVPTPNVILPTTTNPAGQSVLAGIWPGAPSGTTLYAQAWIATPNGVQGFAATNAIVGTTP